MCRVVDVILVSSAHVGGLGQVQDSKQDSRDGEHQIEIDLFQWSKEDIGEYNRRNCPGSSHRTIALVIPVSGDGSEGCQGDTAYIKQDKKERAGEDQPCGLQLGKYPFDIGPEGVQNQHVDPQVKIVGMEKSVSENTVVFFFMNHAGGGEVQAVKELSSPESKHRNKYGQDNDDQGKHRQEIKCEES
jgi:hypothetical protein